MGKEIKNIQMVFPKDGFYASPSLKKNEKAFNMLKEMFTGKTIDIDVSNVPDEQIKKHVSIKEDTNITNEETKKLKFCIDFDGTCVLEMFPKVGPSAPAARKVLKALVKRGYQLILWTARSDKLLEDAIDWFKDNDIELAAVNEDPSPLEGYPVPRKVIPTWYIDDRNLCMPMKEITYNGKEYQVVDWIEIEKELKRKKIL